MATTAQIDATFISLFVVTVFSALLAGSTSQWAIGKGLLDRGFRSKKNQYNIVVVVAASTALIQTVTCFINTIIAPDHIFGFSIFIVLNWVVMTHSSVLLVSRKLSMTYFDVEKAWHRLLWINIIMLPFSLFICITWTTAHNYDSEILDNINRVIEPIQIALWGFIEFCLSGMFIVKMFRFKWTSVEYRGIVVLILVAICDLLSIFLNLFIGDLESTCVKGFVYSLRIRLEVSVLCAMADFVKSKVGCVTFGTSSCDGLGPTRAVVNTNVSRVPESSHLHVTLDPGENESCA